MEQAGEGETCRKLPRNAELEFKGTAVFYHVPFICEKRVSHSYWNRTELFLAEKARKRVNKKINKGTGMCGKMSKYLSYPSPSDKFRLEKIAKRGNLVCEQLWGLLPFCFYETFLWKEIFCHLQNIITTSLLADIPHGRYLGLEIYLTRVTVWTPLDLHFISLSKFHQLIKCQLWAGFMRKFR